MHASLQSFSSYQALVVTWTIPKDLNAFCCSADGLFDPLSQVMEKVIFRSVMKLAKMSLLYF